jgi:hypothetical protein
MPDPYRHSIAELITRYELEPDLRDLYVEGDRDRFLLKWFFKRIGRRGVTVYLIESSVDVPAALLARHGGHGNRGRIIALCVELASALPNTGKAVRGLIDKDYSEILGTIPTARFLIVTEFSCLECYAIGERTLDKFCHLYLGYIVPREHFDEMFGILAELFLLRAAKIALTNSAVWPDSFARLCRLNRGRVYFSRAEFVDRLLNAAAGAIERYALEEKVTELRAKLSIDFRQHLNGHDLIQLFSWYAHQVGVDRSIYNKVAMQRGLLTSIELEELQMCVLFKTLLSWSE